jgi:hypothetical protein
MFFIANSASGNALFWTDGSTITKVANVGVNVTNVTQFPDFPIVFFLDLPNGKIPGVVYAGDSESVAPFTSYFPFPDDATSISDFRFLNGRMFYFSPSGNVYLISTVPEPKQLPWLLVVTFVWSGRVRRNAADHCIW